MQLTIKNCVRCGFDHNDLVFKELTTPYFNEDSGMTTTHYGICPFLLEPILLDEGYEEERKPS